MSRKRPKHDRESEHSLDKEVEEKEQEREEYDAFGFMKDKKQTAAVAGIFFLVGFLISSFLSPPQMTGQLTAGVSAEQIGEDTLTYVNDNLLRDGFTANLDDITEENGMYVLSVSVHQGDSDATQPVRFYVSRSGDLLFYNEPIDMAEEIPVQDDTDSGDTQPQETGVPKTDTPVVNAYVMSYCPYGLQMEKALIPVMELLGGVADINIDYVPYLMHGEKELVQNNYQHCIERDQPDVFLDYMTCFVQSDDHETCMAEAGVDSASLDACVAQIDETYNITGLYEDESTWSGGSYPPYMVDAALAQQYGVRGSPTFVINGQTVQVDRSPEAIKQAICSAFATQPEECSTALSSEGAAPGIGPLSGGTADTAAQC